MELFANLAIGFEQALSAQNLMFCFLGVLVGTMVGVLPGLGPLPTRTPMKQNMRFCALSACSKPMARCAKISIARAQ